MGPDIKINVGFNFDQAGADRLKQLPQDAQRAWAALNRAMEQGGPRGMLTQQAAGSILSLGQQGAAQGFFTREQRQAMDRAISQVRAGIRDYYQAQIDEAKKGAERLAQEMRQLQERLAKEQEKGARQKLSREFIALQQQMDTLRNGGIKENVSGITAERDRMLNMLKDQSALTQMMPVVDDQQQQQQRRMNLLNSLPGQFVRGLIGGAVIGGVGFQLAAKVRQEFHEELNRGMVVADLSQRLRPGGMPYEKFRDMAGSLHPTFSPDESTRFLATYGTLAGSRALGRLPQATGLTRAFGFAPEEGATIFGQATRFGIGQDKLAEAVGQEVVRAQLQGREGEVFHSLLQMSERLIEFLGHAPNLDDMAGLIGRLSMTGLPGLQGEYGARAAMRFDEGVRGTSLFNLPDMRQMALLMTMSEMGISDPAEMMRVQEQGVLGNPALGRGVLQTIRGLGGARSFIGAAAVKQFGLSLNTYDEFSQAFLSSEKSGSLTHLRGLVGADKLSNLSPDKLLDAIKLADRAQREGMSPAAARAELEKLRGEERPEAQARQEIAELKQLEAKAVRDMIPAYKDLLDGVNRAAAGFMDLNGAVAQQLENMGVPQEKARAMSPFATGGALAVGAGAAWSLAKVASRWMLRRGAAAATGAAAGSLVSPGVGTALGLAAGALGGWDLLPESAQEALKKAPGQVWDYIKTHGGYRGYLRGLITQSAEKEGVPAAALLALARTETGIANVMGPATRKGRAYGVMQILQGKEGPYPFFSQDQLMTPEINIPLGAKYFRGLVDKYDGDLTKAAAAYNAGPGAVDKYGGVPPYKETQEYGARFQRFFGEEAQRLSGHVTVYLRDEKTGELKAEAKAPVSTQPTGSPAAAVR